MLGPYIVSRLNEDLIFDLHFAWGRSSNKLITDDKYSDRYSTDRWKIETHFTGGFDYENWHIAPTLAIKYLEEKQNAFTSSTGLIIDAQTEKLGRVSFGPELSYLFHTSEGLQVRPSVSVKGVWNFETVEIEDSNGSTFNDDKLNAQLSIGANILSLNGILFDVSYTYGGIGIQGYREEFAELLLHIPLNIKRMPGASIKTNYSITGNSQLASFQPAITKVSFNIPF